MEQKNTNTQNSKKNNNQKNEEDSSIMSLLWEGIINLWNPGDNKGKKTSQTNNKKKRNQKRKWKMKEENMKKN